MATPFVGRWGNRFASSVMMAPMTAAFTAVHAARGLELSLHEVEGRLGTDDW
jgi:hypothetical protein